MAPWVVRRSARRKTHLTLLGYIAILVVGSSVWLKFSIDNDASSTGALISRPAWVSSTDANGAVDGDGDGKVIISPDAFKLDVDFDHCGYDDKTCQEGALVKVTATLDMNVANAIQSNTDGLYLVLRKSTDWKTWQQANVIQLPRELFTRSEMTTTSDIDSDVATKLGDAFSSALVAAEKAAKGAYFGVDCQSRINPITGKLIPNTQCQLKKDEVRLQYPPGRVPLGSATDSLVTSMKAIFTGYGSTTSQEPNAKGGMTLVTVSDDRILTTLQTTANHLKPTVQGTTGRVPNCLVSETADTEYLCSISKQGYLAAYVALANEFMPVNKVTTTACVGHPGFVYVAGCVTAGYPPESYTKYNCVGPGACSEVSGPPFPACRALKVACGGTCRTKVGPATPSESWRIDNTRKCDFSLQGDHPSTVTTDLARYGHQISRQTMAEMQTSVSPLTPASVLFAIMLALGLCSTIQMYAPGIGQRQGQRPTWDKLKSAIAHGDLITRTDWKHRKDLRMSKRQDTYGGGSYGSNCLVRNHTAAGTRQGDGAPMLEMGEQRSDAHGHAGGGRAYAGGLGAPDMENTAGGRESYVEDQYDEQADVMLAAQATGTYEMNLPEAALASSMPSVGGNKGKNKLAIDGNGQSTCSFSISAGEGRNIILRNLMGKVAANLNLFMQTHQNGLAVPATDLQILDGFADEGHRLGAYYLQKAVSVAFYLAMPVPVASKIANSWVKKMNDIESAKNVDIFDESTKDKSKHPNLFLLLSELDQRRSPIQFIQMWHGLFHTLNSFTLPIDEALLDHALDLPLLGPAQRANLLAELRNRVPQGTAASDAKEMLLQSEEALKALMDGAGVSDKRALVQHILPEALERVCAARAAGEDDGGPTLGELVLLQSSAESSADFDLPTQSTERVTPVAAPREAAKNGVSARIPKISAVHGTTVASTRNGGPSRAASRAVSRKMNGNDSPSPGGDGATAQPEATLSLFHPTFVRSFMSTFTGVQPASKLQNNGENKTPVNASAFFDALRRLERADPLACEAYFDISRTLLAKDEKLQLAVATQKRHLAFDHVEVVAAVGGQQPTILAVYIARGRPDKWQPWTKKDHRRRLAAGVWVCKAPPARATPDEFWAARREVGIVENLDPGFFEYAQVYYYASSSDANMRAADPGSKSEKKRDIQVYNQHLGKAGGLNFGLEAIFKIKGVRLPTTKHPLMFGIIDARHSCDGRFWCEVLPAFFLLTGDSDEHVVFDPDICLCQLPHSYIGTAFETDKLDMRNDFLFSGMGIVRDRSYGMTSCGTGGIWSVTTHEDANKFFYGRCMIEDTSTTHCKFMQGKCSVYLPTKRGTNDQLMRAIPKVSANYLEALERWDTGAIQILISLSMPSPSFWLVLLYMVSLTTCVLLPTFTHFSAHDALYYFFSGAGRNDPVLQADLDQNLALDIIMLLVSAIFFATTFAVLIFLSITAPRKLNYLLRYLIILFNSIYPFNAITTLFWVSLAPWLTFTAKFPFPLAVVPATVGSLCLRLLEFAIVAKMKKDAAEQGATLAETSIYRSQQLDLVTVPIKLRAIMAGVRTGYRDVFQYHDNSWWESFGGGHAKSSVQAWLMLVYLFMILSLIIGPVNILISVFSADSNTAEQVFPVLFGMVTALINLFVLYDPVKYLFQDKGDRPKFSLRYTNLLVLVTIAIVALEMRASYSNARY